MTKEKFRLRDEITGEVQETLYTIGYIEQDYEIPELEWYYLVSEYNDENIEFEPKYNLHYAKITNNEENLLV